MQGQNTILWPVVAMVLLTAVVWVRLYIDRVREMRAQRIHPEKLVSAGATATLLKNVQSSDNLRNLFELPVLFYVLCLALVITGQTTPSFVAGAWAYVALRVAHSAIHLSYNRVVHRFLVYASSGFVLFALWALFAWRLWFI